MTATPFIVTVINFLAVISSVSCRTLTQVIRFTCDTGCPIKTLVMMAVRIFTVLTRVTIVTLTKVRVYAVDTGSIVRTGLVETVVYHRTVSSGVFRTTVTEDLTSLVVTDSMVITSSISAVNGCQHLAVSSCGCITTNAFITPEFIDTLPSITWLQKTLVFVHLTLEPVERGRTGTMETPVGVCTIAMVTEVGRSAFIHVFIALCAGPS